MLAFFQPAVSSSARAEGYEENAVHLKAESRKD